MADRDRLRRLVEGEHAYPRGGSGEPAHMLDASLLADALLQALDRVDALEGAMLRQAEQLHALRGGAGG